MSHPKKDRANGVKDFRPISLVSFVYKFMAKVLANRLKKVLPSTILDFQGTFIVRIQILDQALSTLSRIVSNSIEGNIIEGFEVGCAKTELNRRTYPNRLVWFGFL